MYIYFSYSHPPDQYLHVVFERGTHTKESCTEVETFLFLMFFYFFIFNNAYAQPSACILHLQFMFFFPHRCHMVTNVGMDKSQFTLSIVKGALTLIGGTSLIKQRSKQANDSGQMGKQSTLSTSCQIIVKMESTIIYFEIIGNRY